MRRGKTEHLSFFHIAPFTKDPVCSCSLGGSFKRGSQCVLPGHESSSDRQSPPGKGGQVEEVDVGLGVLISVHTPHHNHLLGICLPPRHHAVGVQGSRLVTFTLHLSRLNEYNFIVPVRKFLWQQSEHSKATSITYVRLLKYSQFEGEKKKKKKPTHKKREKKKKEFLKVNACNYTKLLNSTDDTWSETWLFFFCSALSGMGVHILHCKYCILSVAKFCSVQQLNLQMKPKIKRGYVCYQ